MGTHIRGVNPLSVRMGENDETALKKRLRDALGERTLRWLAAETGDDYKQVQRWVSGGTTIPADFLTRFVRAVPGVDPQWLLVGGTKKPAPNVRERVNTEPIGDAERLDLLRMLAGVQAAVAGGGTASTPTQAEMAALERRATSLGETIAPVEDTERRNHGAG